MSDIPNLSTSRGHCSSSRKGGSGSNGHCSGNTTGSFCERCLCVNKDNIKKEIEKKRVRNDHMKKVLELEKKRLEVLLLKEILIKQKILSRQQNKDK